MRTQSDDDGYKVSMEKALDKCDSARSALVSILDASGVKKKRWPW